MLAWHRSSVVEEDMEVAVMTLFLVRWVMPPLDAMEPVVDAFLSTCIPRLAMYLSLFSFFSRFTFSSSAFCFAMSSRYSFFWARFLEEISWALRCSHSAHASAPSFFFCFFCSFRKSSLAFVKEWVS
jgi:hypothetical protein